MPQYNIHFWCYISYNYIVPNFIFALFIFDSSETQMTLGGKESEESSCKPIFSTLPETNILNVVKVGKTLMCVFKSELEPFTFVVNGFKTK